MGPETSEFVLKFFTVLYIHFIFRIFEQLALALKTEFVLSVWGVGAQPSPPPFLLIRLLWQKIGIS